MFGQFLVVAVAILAQVLPPHLRALHQWQAGGEAGPARGLLGQLRPAGLRRLGSRVARAEQEGAGEVRVGGGGG